MKDDRIGKLRRVVKVDEELARSHVLFEVFDEDVPHSPEDPRHAVVLEPPDEKLMMHPSQLGHHIDDTFANYLFFRDAEDLACDLIAEDEFPNRLFILIGQNRKAKVVDVIH